jgi:UDP-N-acetyl-D-mannosaminuronic acid dehydrogenase
MQLAAFGDNAFSLGHSAMLVNEGLPLYIVSRLEKRFDLPNLTVGILGMSFKAESDDIRSSLSYKLRRVLKFKAKAVVSTDPYVTEETDDTLLPLELVLEKADILVIATPHPEYRNLVTDKPVADVWNIRGAGVLV